MAKTPKIIIQKATAFQLKPGNSYLIHLPDTEQDDIEQLKTWLKERGINDVVIITTETINISEVPELPNVAQ